MFDVGRDLPAERSGVLLAEVDLVFRAAGSVLFTVHSRLGLAHNARILASIAWHVAGHCLGRGGDLAAVLGRWRGSAVGGAAGRCSPGRLGSRPGGYLPRSPCPGSLGPPALAGPP